jgi:Family of unknown function (DUF6262)
MRRNVEGLKRSAQLRSEEARQRALVALSRMESSSREINFRTVANEARVSPAWLYNHSKLRSRIMQLRTSQTSGSSAGSERTDREALSKKNIIATLRLRIKKLEQKNQELNGLLEHAYGVIAQGAVGHSDSSPTIEESTLDHSGMSIREHQ